MRRRWASSVVSSPQSSSSSSPSYTLSHSSMYWSQTPSDITLLLREHTLTTASGASMSLWFPASPLPEPFSLSFFLFFLSFSFFSFTQLLSLSAFQTDQQIKQEPQRFKWYATLNQLLLNAVANKPLGFDAKCVQIYSFTVCNSAALTRWVFKNECAKFVPSVQHSPISTRLAGASDGLLLCINMLKDKQNIEVCYFKKI